MRDARWTRYGGIAGLLYVVVAVVAGTLTGVPPTTEASDDVFKEFFIEKNDLLVAQAWMYALAAPLLLLFALAVRVILRKSDTVGNLGDLFLVGITVIVGLLLVAMAMQIVIARAADRLDADTVRVFGAGFGLVLIAMWGFVMAAIALAYAIGAFTDGVLPRWTAWLAIVAAIANVVGTVGVFVGSGPFSIEGAFTAWAPALSVTVWVVGTSIALLRIRDRTGSLG